jgi:hypothetical protein
VIQIWAGFTCEHTSTTNVIEMPRAPRRFHGRGNPSGACLGAMMFLSACFMLAQNLFGKAFCLVANDRPDDSITCQSKAYFLFLTSVMVVD